MSQRYALAAQKASHVLRCVKSSVTSKSKGGDCPPPCCTGEALSGVLYSALRPPAPEGQGPVGAGPEKGHMSNNQILYSSKIWKWIMSSSKTQSYF